MTTATESSIEAALGLTPGERAFCIVDAARDFSFVHAAQSLGLPTLTLFEGRSAAELAHVAPYLIPIDAENAFLAQWPPRLGKSAGVLFVAKADDDALKKHCRTIFVVKDETGQELFFRFYDPRVLRPFLPTCHVEDLVEFFGPIARFVVENEAGDGLLRFRVDSGRLAVEAFPLASSAPVGTV